MNKRTVKIILSLFAALALLWGQAALGAAAPAAGTCGDAATWRLDDAGVLTISGAGDMTDLTVSPWRDAQVKAVVIEDGVTGVGANAFAGCESLADVRVPESLTRIGNGAFRNCTALTALTLPDHMEEIGAAAFRNCRNLHSIRLPLTLHRFGEGAFVGCKSLCRIALPRGIGCVEAGAFSGCKNLRAVCAPEDVNTFGFDAFDGCGRLEKLVVRNPDCYLWCAVPASAVVYGPPDSFVEEVALAQGRAFVPIDRDDTICGDPDHDHAVTAADARVALRAAVGLEALGEREALADVDLDGAVTAADARFILRAAVGLEVLF